MKYSRNWQGFLELWGEGETWDELIASVKSFPKARRECWNEPNITFKFVVDGWGKAIKQEDQIAIMHKFQFLGLQVRPGSCYGMLYTSPDLI